MSESPSLSVRYCRFVARQAGVILILVAMVFAGAVALATRLQLKTAFVELLPSNDPGVVALAKVQQRMGDLSLLLIGVRSPDKGANIRYAEALTAKLRALPPSVCALATYNVSDLKAFFEANKWLYLSEDDLTNVRDRLRKEVSKRKNPLTLDLSDDEETIDQMRERITQQDKLGGKFPGGVFSNKEGTYLWVAALPPGGIFGERSGEELYYTAKRLLGELDGKQFHPELATNLMGPVAGAVITRAAVESDILWVTISCAFIVALSIGLYFRRIRVVPLIGIPAVVGTVIAFAVAQVAFGYVNSSTAFLGSIILGNGINYGIILMSRYYEERATGISSAEALERAVDGSVRGTGVAAICASGAYASLMLTSFRGFFQFGVMGAAGSIACWLVTFTMLPALLTVLDRRAKALDKRAAPLSLAWLGRVVAGRTTALLVVSIALTVLSVRGVVHFGETPFEYNFRNLNVRTDSTPAAEEFADQQDALFRRWPQPYIVLADRTEDVGPIKEAIRRQDQKAKAIGQIVTIYDILPGTSEEQRTKLALLADIRKMVHDPALDAVDEKERKQLKEIDPPTDLRVLVPDDLPPLARRPFTEVDGSIGKVVLVYYAEKGLSVMNGRDLLRIADVIQRIDLPDGRKLETSGNAVVFSAMLRSVLRDGPIATAAALVVVLALIILVMRPLPAAAMAILSLVIGVAWMVGAAGWAEVKITFLNFIALPITFGIGAEYALNVVSRFQQGRDMVRAVASTGAAVALCSWTTIVGYGSLLAARNRALQGFGAMAILGEVACLTAAVVALPSLILWLERRRHRSLSPQLGEPPDPV